MAVELLTAYSGHALDLGTITFTPSAGTLVGTRAILRIGVARSAALVELESDVPPAEGVFTWDDSTGELVVDLAASHVDALQVGYESQVDITIERADGTALHGATYRLLVLPVVGDI